MKFSCEKNTIKEALSIVQKAINAQNTMQILGNILVHVTSDIVKFSATNLEIAISTEINADIENEGSITLPARLLVNYISLLSDGIINLELINEDTIKIISEDSETEIKGLPSSDFPDFPKIEPDFSYEIPSDNFKKSIDRIVFSCSPSSARPVLSGVFFTGENKKLIMVGTDSYRLGEQKILLKTDLPNDKYIIPARPLQELSRIIDTNSTVKIQVSKHQVLFSVNNISLTSRLIEGNFPDYKRIIPNDSLGNIIVSRSDFRLAVKRIGIFAKETENNILRLNIENDFINITTDQTEIGSGNTKVKGKMEGEGVTIALNALYLLDIIQALSSENIKIIIGNPLAPIKILPETDDEFVHIVMPLKI
jgi:DNA polymerase-3 subunit beta